MSVDQLKGLFQNHGIRRVAIIDDAYLGHPTLADLRSVDGLKTLWAAIEASDELLEFLKEQGISLTAPEDISAARLDNLYELRDKNADLNAALTAFDTVQTSKREQLGALVDLLAELAVVPEQLPPLGPLKADSLPDLIFLDYYLDPAGLESSLPLARSVGENIRNSYVQQPKPYVVLMSTLTDISAQNKSLFRETAGLIGGMFHFIPKAELQERQTLLLKLALMVRSCEEGRKIQQFIEGYDGAIHDIATEFQNKIRGLSLEDYAYIQKMSLQGEGQPLGDYVFWLFGQYFSHLLARTNPGGRKLLDAIVFSHIPDAMLPPSPDFVGLYQNIVSEAVEELGTHPRLSEAEHRKLGDKAPPDAHFGDLFFREDGAVLMVATAECDLAYAPEPQSGRTFDPEQPVILVPGELQRHPAFLTSEMMTTEYVELDGKNHRILWTLKKFKTMPAGVLRTLRDEKFIRRRRLRMPFCHAVQQALTKDIERIGIPIAPPMVRSAAVVIYYKADEIPYRTIAGPKDGATVSFMIRGEIETIQLRLTTVALIVAECSNALVELEKLRDKDARKSQAYERDIVALQTFLASMKDQLVLADSFALKLSEEYQVHGAPIKVLRRITEDQLKNWRPRQPIIVVVMEESAPDNEVTTEIERGCASVSSSRRSE